MGHVKSIDVVAGRITDVLKTHRFNSHEAVVSGAPGPVPQATI